jgi:hypothetical protein
MKTDTKQGFKLLKVRKDGTLGPLFINARARLRVGEWMPAEAHRRKGFAFRPGWHVMAKPEAPHLKTELASGERRQFWEVEIADYIEETRPESQGGVWYLAQKMRLVAPARSQ